MVCIGYLYCGICDLTHIHALPCRFNAWYVVSINLRIYLYKVVHERVHKFIWLQNKYEDKSKQQNYGNTSSEGISACDQIRGNFVVVCFSNTLLTYCFRDGLTSILINIIHQRIIFPKLSRYFCDCKAIFWGSVIPKVKYRKGPCGMNPKLRLILQITEFIIYFMLK